jgi:hypothetical protein
LNKLLQDNFNTAISQNTIYFVWWGKPLDRKIGTPDEDPRTHETTGLGKRDKYSLNAI